VTFDGADGRPIVAVHDPVTRISLQRSGFDANRNVSANIGLGILRQFNITFDYARQRMILEPSHFFGQPDIYDRTGLRLERDGSGWKVTAVIPDSPASAAGLKAGDHITTIDSKTAKQVNEDELRTLLKGPVGRSVRLEVGTAPGTTYETLVLKDVI
jgi:S1-C subfamily serine protease